MARSVIFGALALMTTAVFIYTQIPRSVKNNNPLNIRESAGDKTQWDGEAADNRDPSFEEFDNPIMGFRAAGKILLNYQRLYGLDTVEQMINRFAPPVENNTSSYIQHVADELGINANAPVQLTENTLAKMLHVMSTHETGRIGGFRWFSYGQALAGAKMALTL